MGTFLFDATKLLRLFSRHFAFCLPLLTTALPHPALAEGIVQVQPAGFYLPDSPTWMGATPAAVCVSNPNFCGRAPGTLVSSMACGIVPGSAVINPGFCNGYTLPIAPLSSCPPNSTGTPTATNPTICTCDAKFQPDAAGTKCVSDCPVTPLDPLPADDLCAQSLEAGRGADINNACPSLTPEMQSQAQCVADKIQKLGLRVPYTKPSATIRNAAYQNHLRAVWDKSIEIKNNIQSDAEKQACAAVIADVNSHITRHNIISQPSSSGNLAPHVNGRAIDIPSAVIKALTPQVTAFNTIPKPLNCLPCKDTVTVINDVQDYVNSTTTNPPACNVRWGGRFTPLDLVHFQLP